MRDVAASESVPIGKENIRVKEWGARAGALPAAEYQEKVPSGFGCPGVIAQRDNWNPCRPEVRKTRRATGIAGFARDYGCR